MIRISRAATVISAVAISSVCLGQSVVEQALGFEREGLWFTAPNLTKRFQEEDLWATRSIPFEKLAGKAERVEQPRRSGRYALRWADHPQVPTLHTPHVPADWTAASGLGIWIHSARATGELITVGVLSDSDSTRWADYFVYTFPVDWTGWKDVQIPRAAFEAQGQPAGWQQVDALYFFTKIFNHQPHPATTLCLDDCRLIEEDVETTASAVPVPKANGLTIKGQIPAFDASILNHDGPEIRDPAQAVAPIEYQPYFKTERALLGYHPRFQPGFVSFAPDGTPFVIYGSCILQTVDDNGQWQVRDLVREVLEPYARNNLGFAELGVGNTGQGNEGAIRFDNDGDAYLLAYIWDPTKDWRSRTGLLLYSPDNLATWQVYRLPTYFARFEKIVGHNLDCRARPPVILLTKYFAPTTVSILIPEKTDDRRLDLPTPVTVAENALAFLPHSGEANQALTHGNTVFIVFGQLEVLPGHTVEEGVPNYIVTYDINTRTLSNPVLLGFGGRNAKDDHNWSALAADSNGFLHVIINGHHDPFVYVRSKRPWDISEWTAPEKVASGTSYAGLVIDNQDTLYTVTRCSDPGYYFRLTLHRKRAGQPWEEPRHLVIPFKPYYKVWFHKLVIDPLTQRLFLSYFSQSPSICVFRDEFDAYTYIWPDREKDFLAKEDAKLPLGTYCQKPRKYAFFSPPASELSVLISDDRGESWRLATTPDFITNN